MRLLKGNFFITYHVCGMQMPKIWDFGSEKNTVPLHSEIGDVHQLAADVDYFFRARMLRTLSLRKIKTNRTTASPPALSRREGAGRQQDFVNRQKSKGKSL